MTDNNLNNSNQNLSEENKITTKELIKDIETDNNTIDNISDGKITGEPSDPCKMKTFFKGLFEYIETFCYALVLMILLFMFVFRYVSVEGLSMYDTLNNEDKLVISNLAYTPKTGDIVVLKYSPKPLIKRVIATGGQKVKIDYKNWSVYVDDVKLEESYVTRTSGEMHFGDEDIEKFTVEEGMVYVMGDNRNNSTDSRIIGELSEKDILGRVIFRVFPINKFGAVDD